jgi:hypothetical protein
MTVRVDRTGPNPISAVLALAAHETARSSARDMTAASYED